MCIKTTLYHIGGILIICEYHSLNENNSERNDMMYNDGS